MADTMLERCALAIGNTLYAYVDPDGTPNTWASSLAAARAALEAIRDESFSGTIHIHGVRIDANLVKSELIEAILREDA